MGQQEDWHDALQQDAASGLAEASDMDVHHLLGSLLSQ